MEGGFNKWRMGNVRTVGQCSVCVIFVGFVMLVAGAVISGIAYTEVRPNVADENYERYIRSDPKRVVGPIMLAFGLLCIVGGCVFFGCTLCSASLDTRRRNRYNARAHAQHLPGADSSGKKMLP